MKSLDPVFSKRFDVAVLIAIAAGKLPSPEKASTYCSFANDSYFFLKERSSIPIIKISLDHLDKEVSERPNAPNVPDLLEDVLSPAELDRQETELAIKWAMSMGYPIPEKPMGGISALLFCCLAFLLCFIPGIFAILYVNNRSTQYARDTTALRTKWVDAGKPEPGEEFKEVTKRETVVEKIESASADSVEERLLELNSMKEKSLITEEEYQAMRKKALGL